MSTSYHGGLVTPAESLYGAAADPADTTLLRDAVANGLLHCADSYAQVRVNLMYPAAAVAGLSRPYATIASSPTAGPWYPVIGSPYGAWPLTCHADGTPYRLRIRVGTSASAGGNTHAWRIVIAPLALGLSELGRAADHIYEIDGTSSTSIAWSAGATRGSDASEHVLTVSREVAAGWLRMTSVYDAVSAGSPSTAQQLLVCAHVFARTDNASDLPRLHALYIAEHVGP